MDILLPYLNDENIIIMSWNSNCNIAYKHKDYVIINPLNIKIIDNLDKKYALVVGDAKIPNLKIKVLKHENEESNIFNYIN